MSRITANEDVWRIHASTIVKGTTFWVQTVVKKISIVAVVFDLWIRFLDVSNFVISISIKNNYLIRNRF